jgi:hypothetical protein
MALPFMMLLMRRAQNFAFMTPADYDVFFAICTGKTIGTNTLQQARTAMAAAAGRHVRTTQKSTTRLVAHGVMAITQERIGPRRNKVNVYRINEGFFRTFLRGYTADFQRHILHKRAHAQDGHRNPRERENSPKRPAQKCSEEVASKWWPKGSDRWYYAQGLTPPWEEEAKKSLPGVRKE